MSENTEKCNPDDIVTFDLNLTDFSLSNPVVCDEITGEDRGRVLTNDDMAEFLRQVGVTVHDSNVELVQINADLPERNKKRAGDQYTAVQVAPAEMHDDIEQHLNCMAYYEELADRNAVRVANVSIVRVYFVYLLIN